LEMYPWQAKSNIVTILYIS